MQDWRNWGVCDSVPSAKPHVLREVILSSRTYVEARRKIEVAVGRLHQVLRDGSSLGHSRFHICFHFVRVLVELLGFRSSVPSAADKSHGPNVERKLEGGNSIARPPVLPTDSDIRREAEEGRFPGNKGARRGDSSDKSRACAGAGLITMPTVEIGRNENLQIRYRVPKDRIVEFDVRADRPVKTYIMREGGIERFERGEPFRYYGGFQDPPKKLHHQELILPFDGHWYLLIMNPSKTNPVEVTYQVYY